MSALVSMTPSKSKQATIISHVIAICFLFLAGVLVIATSRVNGTTKKCAKLMTLGAPAALIILGKKTVKKDIIISVKLVRYNFLSGFKNCLLADLLVDII